MDGRTALVGGGALALIGGLVWVAVSSSSQATGVRRANWEMALAQLRSASPGTAVRYLVPVGALVTVGVWIGMLLGVAAALVAGVCLWALSIQGRSLLNVREADQLAQLTAALANQATAATTVVVAVQDSAPLVSGRIGQAARQMADEIEIGSLPEAADRFAATVGRPIAAMIASVLIEAHAGGIQWGALINVLDKEAAEAAATARHFHRHVGSMMGQVVATLVLSAGVIGLTGMAAGSIGEWLTSPDGQSGLLAAAGMIAVVHAWVLAQAGRELR